MDFRWSCLSAVCKAIQAKGCFDNINHAVLVDLLNNKIKDARIIKLIYKFLKAGCGIQLLKNPCFRV